MSMVASVNWSALISVILSWLGAHAHGAASISPTCSSNDGSCVAGRVDPLTRHFQKMLKSSRGKQQLRELSGNCTDYSLRKHGVDCESMDMSMCDADGKSGRAARALCPRICNACAVWTQFGGVSRMANTLKKNFARLHNELHERGALEGVSPRPSKVQVGKERMPILIVDDFLPTSIVERARTLAIESMWWKPEKEEHSRYWNFNQSAPRDEQGLFAPPKMAQGFPGIKTPLTGEYTRMMWTRCQGLDLPRTFKKVLGKSKFDMELAPHHAFHQLLCLSPNSLHPDQGTPHVDPGMPPPSLALVHFMSNWSANRELPGVADFSGGIGFFGERVNNGRAYFSRATCANLQHGAGSVVCKDSLAFNCSVAKEIKLENPKHCEGVSFSHRLSRKRQYPLGDEQDKEYELLHVVPPRFNRAVIYSTDMLHSQYIDKAALQSVSCDPSSGRLVTSFFLR